MQDKTSKKPKGKAKELESLGATTKVQAKAFMYSSEETRWIDPPWSYTTIRSHRKWPRRRGTYAR